MPNSSSARVALVTGASSGIGAATARRLAADGQTVYGAARRLDRLQELAADGVIPLAMDVTDEASMRAGIESIVREHGRLDVLVNNAGYGSYGALEDVPLEEARRQFEVNVFGAARLMQLVLPQMRAQRSGRIINVSSMGGQIYTPLGSWYHATKFALEAISDCVRVEVAPFGVDVVIIEPGGIRTEWGGIAADNLIQTSAEGRMPTRHVRWRAPCPGKATPGSRPIRRSSPRRSARRWRRSAPAPGMPLGSVRSR